MANYSYPRDLEQGPNSYELQPEPTNPMTLILLKRQQITEELGSLRTRREIHLPTAQQALLDSTGIAEDQQARSNLDRTESEITTSLQRCRSLLSELRDQVSAAPDARARTQLDVASGNVQTEIAMYYRAQSDFNVRLREQVRRQYHVAHPAATEEDVESGVQNVLGGTEQTFKIQGMRSTAARDAQDRIAERSAALRKIERDFIELNTLSQEVAQLVHLQDPVVENIEEKTKEVADDTLKANDHLDKGITSARNARKWKWWALFIVILIIAIIVAACVGWCKTTDHC
ncbi:t-SNARE [Aspergillus campestris IBT 28561]|uniref:t-SNARE n=1 Tax=Aspergillus campestris (strain IBT 28561) TaxID=1392248 RepID=A0A2I1DD15_ASPC2|nr:t-SNARE [Aspergillus campestris IBT 28561]PKY07773.1 t-SNARE [Aspergillus campestris IBT 28561]